MTDDAKRHAAQQFFQGVVLDILGGRRVERNPAANAPLINQFVRDERVIIATKHYLQGLMRLWNERNPDVDFPIKTKPRQAASGSQPQMPPVMASAPGLSPAAPQPVVAPSPLAPEPPVAELEETSVLPASMPAVAPSSALSAAVPPLGAPSAQAVAPLRPGQVPAVPVAPTPVVRSIAVKFHLPNAKAGVPYLGELLATDPDGHRVTIKDVIIPPALGLSFDSTTGNIRGTPLVSGEFQLSVRCLLAGGAEQSGQCEFIVNPDPKSLWKCLEPAADAKYRKPHVHCTEVDVAQQPFRLIAASRRGRSHEHAGSHRDDDYCVEHVTTTGWTIMIVADGAGSAQYSREGSRLAVRTAGDHLLDVLAGDQGAAMAVSLDSAAALPALLANLGSDFHYLYHKAASLAVQAIEAEAAATGSQPRDYATTFLAVATHACGDKLFVASFWMGDGAIAVYGPQGVVKLMGTPDGGEYAGQTRFLDRAALSDAGFGKRVRVGAFEGFNAVMVMTDGVSDPYFETDSGLADGQRWERLWSDLAAVIADSDAKQALAEWLHFFVAGHHDDRTLALLWPDTAMATAGEQ